MNLRHKSRWRLSFKAAHTRDGHWSYQPERNPHHCRADPAVTLEPAARRPRLSRICSENPAGGDLGKITFHAGWETESSLPRPGSTLRGGVRQALLWVLFAVTGLSSGLFAEEKVFTLGGATLLLQDVSAEVDVSYRSMRWNRALNVWNVEATLTNHGSRSVPGPWVLLVESYQNTTGPQGADGFDDSTPPKPFYDFTALVPNGELATGQSSGARTLALGAAAGSPSLVTRVYAGRELGGAGLALARTVNDVGQPLPGVQTAEEGPTAARTYTTDPVFGVVTVGQGSGGHVWKFSAPGYLPVWRQQNLSTNVAVLANPRLTPLGTNVVVITTMSGGQLMTPGGSIQIRFSPGAMSEDTPVTLTPLSAQTLPGFLPLGWSPLQAFWVESAGTSAVPATVALVPWGPLSIGETAALARWNESAVKWEVAQLLTGDGTNAVSTSITASGAYALVVGDVAPNAPPVPQVGQALLPVQAVLPDVADLSAAGSVAPTSSPASRRPESVTATAEVVVTNRNGALPSGLVLRCEVTESYRLNDSTRRRPPRYESFVVGYQRPGDTNGSTLHTRFPLRPLLLFGAEELTEAKVKVDVLPPTPFTGGVLDVAGGLVSSEGVRVLAGTNDVIGRQAALLRRIDPTNFVDFATNGIAVAAAFEFSMAGVAPDHRLAAQFESLPATTNRHYVLARVLYDLGEYGLLPVERLTSDGANRLIKRRASDGRTAARRERFRPVSPASGSEPARPCPGRCERCDRPAGGGIACADRGPALALVFGHQRCFPVGRAYGHRRGGGNGPGDGE